MLARVYSSQIVGLSPEIIDVEIDISNGLHSFSIVGLPDKAIDEAKDRISAAIKNSDIKSPQKTNKKIVVSLAPADLKKEGPVFDLAIAVAYLIATGEIKQSEKKQMFLGELSLTGELRPVRGVLYATKRARDLGFDEIYLPKENAREASLIEGISVYGVTNLRELVDHFSGKKDISASLKTEPEITDRNYYIDWSDVRGQESAKRGLMIAGAGKHNIAMSGPPGTGKTMLAKAFQSILPNLAFDEMIETTGIHSVTGALGDKYLLTTPPLRTPHHSASHVALVGGGAIPKPGEITLAHNGVLFLDEFPEFERRVIEALRQPLEDRIVSVSRARGTIQFPANFILIATMNPCPCGNYEVVGKECVCMPSALERYRRKLSGPIVDRIDLWLDVPQIDYEKLSSKERKGPSSEEVREVIEKAREIQRERFKDSPNINTNSEMGPKELELYAPLSENLKVLLNSFAKKLDLSARAYHRVIKLARTIADLDDSTDVKEEHLLEALQYRPKKVA